MVPRKINSAFFRKRELFVRLSFFVLTLCVFLLLYTINYNHMKNEIEVTEVYQAQQVTVKFEYYLKNITAGANYNTNNVLLPMSNATPENINQIHSFINLFKVTYGGVEDICMSNGVSLFGSNNLLFGEIPDKSIGNYNSCKFYISDLDNWSRKLYVLCNGSLNDTVIKINIIECLREIYPNTVSYGKDVMLITNDGTVLAFSDRTCIGLNLSTLLGKDWDKSYSHLKSYKFDNKSYYFTSKKLSETGLSIVFLSPKAGYMSAITNQTIKAVIYCAVLMLAFGMVFAFIMRRMNEQMRVLAQKIEEANIIKRSDFSSDAEFLEHGLIGFSEKLADLQSELGVKIENLRTAQVTALQLQINPHFLFNTIDSINWRAAEVLGVDNDISKSLVNLSNIFSYSMDINIISVELIDEINITKKYLELVNVRCCSEICVVWNIEKDLHDAYVPRLSLQPLIENAVTHGFLQNIDENSVIEISAKRYGTDMQLSVEDNGIGLTKEQLTRINNHINTVSVSSSKHIGLRNINARLRLLYGENYGLKLSAGKKGGTRCDMIVPIIKKQQKST